MSELKLEYVPLSTLTRFAENPKLHDIQSLVESFERYGFLDPPKWEKSLNDGEGGLVEGNGREEALEWMKHQGRQPPRGIALTEDGDWAVPVLFGNDVADEATAQLYAIDHNNLVMAGADYTVFDSARLWDENQYKEMLGRLGREGQFPVSVDGDGLDLLLEVGKNGNGGKEMEPQIDKADELRKKWGVELGQMWACGEHRIICGDCTDRAVVERVMGGEKADCTTTDPPFNVREDEWDKFDDFFEFTRRWLSLAKLYSITIAAFFADKYLPLLPKVAELENIPFRRSLIWVKPPGSQFSGGQKDNFWYDFELIQVYGGFIGETDSVRFSVFDYRTITGQQHGAEKPLGLYSDIWQNYSKVNGIIYEPFSGTGSNIIACENLNRRCRAVEISTAYVAVSLERFYKHSNIKPVLIDR